MSLIYYDSCMIFEMIYGCPVLTGYKWDHSINEVTYWLVTCISGHNCINPALRWVCLITVSSSNNPNIRSRLTSRPHWLSSFSGGSVDSHRFSLFVKSSNGIVSLVLLTIVHDHLISRKTPAWMFQFNKTPSLMDVSALSHTPRRIEATVANSAKALKEGPFMAVMYWEKTLVSVEKMVTLWYFVSHIVIYSQWSLESLDDEKSNLLRCVSRWICTAKLGQGGYPGRQVVPGGSFHLPSGYDEQFAMVKPWPIEIDGLPINSMLIFHGELWMS